MSYYRKQCRRCNQDGHKIQDCPVVWCQEGCGRVFDYFDNYRANENSMKQHLKTHQAKTLVSLTTKTYELSFSQPLSIIPHNFVTFDASCIL